ncbi:MAG: HypC/HybG/HupF family hydrogenase formation chaperone, partial [Vicinamibacterales bacterium]
VLQVEGERAEVLYDGRPLWVAVHGIPDLRPAEYVVVYAGQALERIDTDEALALLEALDEIERMYAEALE